jgi:hypothetical protein
MFCCVNLAGSLSSLVALTCLEGGARGGAARPRLRLCCVSGPYMGDTHAEQVACRG